jgi:hypothetical protein
METSPHSTGMWVPYTFLALIVKTEFQNLDTIPLSKPGRGNDGIFPLCHGVQTGSGAHTTSYPMGIGALSLV